MMKYMKKAGIGALIGLLVFIVIAPLSSIAQETNTATSSRIIEPDVDVEDAEFVTINVKNANISEVLKAYSLQTGQSIVVGPDVISDNVNVRLNNIPWEEALDVILKPYGFGYRVVGDTIVISKLENIVTVEGIEPLVSKVFNLGFRDAYDIRAIVEAQLSARGKYTILETKSLPGWEFGGDGKSGAATESGVRVRKQKVEIQKSKTFVVTDVPSALSRIEKIIEKIDLMPQQVLIEAKFLEISTGGLSDIGLDYVQGLENVEDYTTSGGSSLTVSPVDDVLKLLNGSTGYPNPLNTAAAGGFSIDEGITLSHSVLDDWGAEMAFAFIASDEDANVLSAPKILTLNNQEAAILVGQKYPIIDSQNNSSGGSALTSTSLDYYENIGIQLNVIPQVCADNYVNMVVHPAVSEIDSFESGVVTAGSDVQSGTRYPILKIREAETQIMLKSHSTAVIGGLQEERDKETVKKVPFLGDIPYIGRLFRRETITKQKIDLLIFIKASIVEPTSYEAASARQEEMRQARMELEILKDNEDADFSTESHIEDTVAADNAVAALDAGVEDDGSEILALVQSMNSISSTNSAATAK
ncbi:secretin and TonB N-terminal domain-containing protein [Pontiellaceae bacterium B1224]|nr:secretin and TonB N-terminal domain-containing protein [Pontiellaceae bacterium B1224]